MKAIVSFIRKFWISIVVLLCVAFLANVYTAGAILDVLIPIDDTLVSPK